MAETYGYDPGWTQGLGGMPKEPGSLQGVLASIPGLSSYLAMDQYLRSRREQDIADQERASFRQERAAIPAGSPASAYTGVALKYGDPRELLRSGDELVKIEEARKNREEGARMLRDVNRMATDGQEGSPGAAVELGIGQPAGGAPEAPAKTPIETRIAQLRAMSEIPQVANNAAALTSIQREIDRLSQPKPEKTPLIQMIPISATHEQPHISRDNGVTFNPIPGSAPRPIFNPATGPGGVPKGLPEQLYHDYSNHPQVKEANDLEQKIAPLADYMIDFKKTGRSINANDAALAKAYLAATTSLGNRAYTMDKRELGALPNLGDRIGNMASSFFAGKDLTDQSRTEMFNYIKSRYRQLDSARQNQKALTIRRGAARGVTPEQLFGKEPD